MDKNPTPQQKCVNDFYNSQFGKVVQFVDPLALILGWNPNAGAAWKSWSEAILAKGTSLVGTGALSTPLELTTLSGETVVAPGFEVFSKGLLDLGESAFLPLAAVAAGIDAGTHLYCYTDNSGVGFPF
jgi:hypothetical protein